MAQKSVANLKDSVSGILQGLNLNNVKNLFTAFERTARQLAQNISIPTAMGRQSITLYDGVFDYLAPTDIFGSNVVDMQQQGISRFSDDYVYKQYISDFDRTKSWLTNGTQITFEARKGTDIIRIVSTRPTPKIELDPFTATTGWTVSGSASGLALDQTVYYQLPGSLRFTCTGSSTGILTKAIPLNDLTSYVGVGVVFLAIRIPSANSATDLTSITVRLGSDSTNYYEASSTTGFLGAWTVGEFLLVAIDLSTATTTGTPTVTAIDYAQIRIAHTATMTNFYIGDFWIALPSPNTLIYETAAIFKASGSNPSQTISTVSDTVILSDSAYAIYEQECAKAVAKQQGGRLSSGVINNINEDLYGERGNPNKPGLYAQYRATDPSQSMQMVGNYYDD